MHPTSLSISARIADGEGQFSAAGSSLASCLSASFSVLFSLAYAAEAAKNFSWGGHAANKVCQGLLIWLLERWRSMYKLLPVHAYCWKQKKIFLSIAKVAYIIWMNTTLTTLKHYSPWRVGFIYMWSYNHIIVIMTLHTSWVFSINMGLPTSWIFSARYGPTIFFNLYFFWN